MQIYSIPLLTILGCVGLIIYIIIDFKKNKLKNLISRGIFYSFILYLIIVSHLTIGNIFISPQHSFISFQLIPFHFLVDWSIERANGIWFFWNSVKLSFYNLILLFPLGIYLGILFNTTRINKVIIIVFLTSLIIEIFQQILSYFGFIFRRSFDVDDLILNTFGGVLGFLVWLRVKKIYFANISKLKRNF